MEPVASGHAVSGLRAVAVVLALLAPGCGAKTSQRAGAPVPSADSHCVWHGPESVAEQSGEPIYETEGIVAVPSGFVVVWRDGRDVAFGAYSRLLDPDAAPLGPERHLSDALDRASKLSAAWLDGQLGLLWTDYEDVHLGLLDESGRAVANDVWRSEPKPYQLGNFQLVAGDSAFGVLWDDTSPESPAGTWFARVEATGEGRAALPLTADTSYSYARRPQVCFGGDHFAIAWTDRRSGTTEIWLTTIDAEGRGFQSETQVATNEAVEVGSPSVACMPDGVAVGWNELLEGEAARAHLRELTYGGEPRGEELWWPGVFGGLVWNGSELQLFRTGAFGASPLSVTRINGDTTAEQELVRSYAGGALQHPLAVTPARTAMVWHEGARLLIATLECPGL